MRRRHLVALMVAVVVAIALAAPLGAAAGSRQVVRDAETAAPRSLGVGAVVVTPADEQRDRVPFTEFDLALILGGATAVIGLGAGVRRVTGERA